MITSVTNQRVKNIALLRQKSKARNEQDVFIVEGEKMFLEVPEDRICEFYTVHNAGFSPAVMEKISKLNDVFHEEVSEEVFAKMSDTKTPQGILCVVKQYHYELDRLLEKENPFLVILENLQDPGNLGTIMRTAEGAGVDAVIMSKETVDIYNPKTIRATMGSVYRVPFVYVEDIVELIHYLYRRNIHTYAAHLKGENDYTKEDYTSGAAFLIGNEGNGLTDACSDAAEKYIKIPMLGKLESLNAGVAAALLMYETLRQRRDKQ